MPPLKLLVSMSSGDIDTLLGRPLTPDEAREVMNMARRIAAIILLHPTLDENYYQCKANTYKW